MILTRTIYLALPMLAVLVAGCSPHRPQGIDLPAPPPETFLQAEVDETVSPAQGRWWDHFADPRLSALIEEALAHNLDLRQAIARLSQAEAALRASRAAQRPFLNIEAQASRDSEPTFAGKFTGDSHRLSAAAGFEIDLWKKLSSRSKASALEGGASREEIRALMLSVSAQVADFYYLAVEQRSQLSLAEATIASFADALERVKRRYREGLVPALDVYQAQQNLAGARARLPQVQATLAQAEHALSILLGRYPQGGISGTLAELPAVPESFPAGLPSQLLGRRPDVQAALMRVRAGDARVAAAVADRFPSFNLLAGYGEISSAFSTGTITGSFWSLGGSLVQPLIDGGRRRAEVARTRAVFEEGLARYQKTVLTAFQEVEDALVKNRTSEEVLAHQADRALASASALRLAMDRYLQGLSDFLPVLTAQGLDFDAQSKLISGRRQLIADRITLARVLGGDWMAAVRPAASVAGGDLN